MIIHDNPEPVVNNYITDILDAMIQQNLHGVFLIPGEKPGFRRETTRVETPEFDWPVDADEMQDALEALGVDYYQKVSLLRFKHRSELYPDSYFDISITHIGTSGEPPVVRIRQSQAEKDELERAMQLASLETDDVMAILSAM